MSDPIDTEPVSTPAQAEVPQAAQPNRKRVFIIVGGVFMIIVALVAIAAGASSDGDDVGAATGTTAADRAHEESRDSTTTRPRQRPTTTTVPVPEQGSRENPFSNSAPLTTDDFDFSVGPLTAASIGELDDYYRDDADVARPGSALYKALVTVNYHGDETMSSYDIDFSLHLTGQKGLIYDTASIIDFDDRGLGLLSDQPEVLSGGTMQGVIYFVADADDANFLFMWDGPKPQFITVG
jgi:hypothetical protein